MHIYTTTTSDVGNKGGIFTMISKNITFNLSKTDIEEIIIDYFKKNIGYIINPEDISFNINTHLEGYGMNEYEVTDFTGCSVNFVEK